MADWSTVAIAAITALAGLGGGAVSGHYTMKALTKSHKREDAALLRDQVEALFSELDAIQQTSQRNIPKAMEMANGAAPAEPLEGVDLGTVKAIIALYFPDLNGPLDALRLREVAATAALRQGLQGQQPLAAGGVFAVEQSVYVSTFCNEMREALAVEARTVGASVRKSID